MYSYKIKLMFRWAWERILPYREIMIRQSSGGIIHIKLSPLKQFCIAVFLIAGLSWTGFVTYTYTNYGDIIKQNRQELAETNEKHKKLIAEVSAYYDQLNIISEKIDKNIDVSKKDIDLLQDEIIVTETSPKIADKKGFLINVLKNTFSNMSSNSENIQVSAKGINAEEKERLRGDVVWLGRKLNALSSGKTGAVQNDDETSADVALSKAELQRDLALSEARNLRNKVNEMESLISEMQKTQVVVFDKVAGLADDGISALERKLSGVKDALNNVGLGFETLLARVDIEYGHEVASGGPFIPVALSTPITPDLKSEVLNVSLNNLVGGIGKWNNLTKLEERLPIGKPVDRVRMTSRFGIRQDPFTGQRASHEGLDFGGIRGEPIYSTAPGKVVYAGLAGSFGYMVEIDHGLGMRTRYAHLGGMSVKRGEKVEAGQKIAIMGNSGRSTGVHLHYEVRIKGKPLDPLKFVRINRDVSKKY